MRSTGPRFGQRSSCKDGGYRNGNACRARADTWAFTRAYSAGTELRWELTHDQVARTDASVLPLSFRTDIDRVTGHWTMVGLAARRRLGLNSSIIRYDANGTEVVDGGAEVGFIRVKGLTPAALAYGLLDQAPDKSLYAPLSVLRACAWFCVALIAFLSLIPREMEARSGLPGDIEHLVAYAATAGLCQLGDPSWAVWQIVMALLAYASCLEVLQGFAPGRQPSLAGALASGGRSDPRCIGGSFDRRPSKVTH